MRRALYPTLLLLAAATATTANAEPSPEATARRLGTSIEESSVAAKDTAVEWGRAVAVMDAPMDDVRKIVLDYDHYSQFLPHFQKSRVLSRRGANALAYFEATVLRDTVTLWATMRLTGRQGANEAYIVKADMLDGNVNHFSARWELTPVAGGSRTLVTFQILINPGLPMPASVFSSQNRKSAGKTLRALRRRIRAAH